MVSLEDYEYSAFRCAFCKVLNPAKKIRPKAPALSIENIGSTVASTSSTSSSDKDSGSETDDKHKSPMTEQSSLNSDVGDVPLKKEPTTPESIEEPIVEDNLQSPESEEKFEENVEEKSERDKKMD